MLQTHILRLVKLIQLSAANIGFYDRNVFWRTFQILNELILIAEGNSPCYSLLEKKLLQEQQTTLSCRGLCSPAAGP